MALLASLMLVLSNDACGKVLTNSPSRLARSRWTGSVFCLLEIAVWDAAQVDAEEATAVARLLRILCDAALPLKDDDEPDAMSEGLFQCGHRACAGSLQDVGGVGAVLSSAAQLTGVLGFVGFDKLPFSLCDGAGFEAAGFAYFEARDGLALRRVWWASLAGSLGALNRSAPASAPGVCSGLCNTARPCQHLRRARPMKACASLPSEPRWSRTRRLSSWLRHAQVRELLSTGKPLVCERVYARKSERWRGSQRQITTSMSLSGDSMSILQQFYLDQVKSPSCTLGSGPWLFLL